MHDKDVLCISTALQYSVLLTLCTGGRVLGDCLVTCKRTGEMRERDQHAYRGEGEEEALEEKTKVLLVW